MQKLLVFLLVFLLISLFLYKISLYMMISPLLDVKNLNQSEVGFAPQTYLLRGIAYEGPDSLVAKLSGVEKVL